MCVKIAKYQVILCLKHFLVQESIVAVIPKNQQIVSCDGKTCHSCSSPIIPNTSASIMASTDDLNGPQSPNRFLAVSEAPKKSNTKRKSSWLSTKMSRNSSMTSKSRSIPIFVHVGDLLKHPGGSPKFSPDQDNNEDISQVEPDPEQSPMGTSRTIPTGPRPDASSALNLAKQSDKDASQVGLSKEQIEKAPGSGETKPKRNTKSIYSSFPEPPDPLEHFDKWFPESPQTPPVEEKQKARVDKSLPQPPYHVFDSNKKMQLVILVSLAGILSPLSTSIYLPALAPIATVRRNTQKQKLQAD